MAPTAAILAFVVTTTVSAFNTVPPSFTATTKLTSVIVASPSSTQLFVASETATTGAVKQVPHGGGALVDLMVTSEEAKEAAIARATVELQATPRQLCDVELIMNGGFTPLIGFMEEAVYNHVVDKMELPDGTIFGLPVVFDTNDEDLQPGSTVLLKQGDLPIAIIDLTDKYQPDKAYECKKCNIRIGTPRLSHGRHGTGQVLHGWQGHRSQFSCTRVSVQNARPSPSGLACRYRCRGFSMP